MSVRSTHSDIGPTRLTRPVRERRLPTRYDDFVISLPDLSRKLKPRSHSDDASDISGSRQSVCSHLTQKQESQLDTKRKQIQLDELKQCLEEDQAYDIELRRLEEDAQRAQVEAERQVMKARLKAQAVTRHASSKREILNTQLSRMRKMREVENQLEEAKFVESICQPESTKSLRAEADVFQPRASMTPTHMVSTPHFFVLWDSETYITNVYQW